MSLDPDFHFLEVAYPYIARRLLTDEDPELRDRLVQVLFQVLHLQHNCSELSAPFSLQRRQCIYLSHACSVNIDDSS